MHRLGNLLNKIPEFIPSLIRKKLILITAGLIFVLGFLYFWKRYVESSRESASIVLNLLVFFSAAVMLYLARPTLFKKVLSYWKILLPLFIIIRSLILNAWNFSKNWLYRFRQAPNEKRWQMVKIPVIVMVFVVLTIRFGPLFFPPRVAVSFPGDNAREVPLDSKIEIIFDRSVIRKLAELSFAIAPHIDGKISWESDQKFVFTPVKPFERGKVYAAGFFGPIPILSNYLIPLWGKKTTIFTTIGNPKVVISSPRTEALEPMSPVTIIFDRPMIPLTTATNSAEKLPPLTILPEIKGEGRWLGTTAFQFRPSEPYAKSTTYTVSVPSGIKSQDGGILEGGFGWDFSSERPRVIETSPTAGYDFASPVASIAAFFNQNINPASVTGKFAVYDREQKKIAGRIITGNNTIAFYPDTPLNREQQYKAVLSSGIQSTEGPNGMENEYDWDFKTAALPDVAYTKPFDGERDVIEQYSIQIHFKTPMDEESFKDSITISPQPDKKPTVSYYGYGSENILSIGTYLGRSTVYTITLSGKVKDQYGVALGKPYSFSFSTSSYKPAVSIYPFGTYFGAFNQEIIPRVIVQAVNANRVDYSLYKLTKEDVLDLYRRRYDQQCGSDDSCRNWQNYDTGKLLKIRNWSESYSADFNTPVQVVTKVTAPGGDKLSPGFYFLDARIPQGAHDNMVMIVTRSTISIKRSDKQIFVWSVNQSSGDVTPGMKISVTDIYGNNLISGTTNNDGVFMKDTDLFQKNTLFVFGEKNDDSVLAGTMWNQGISQYDFGLPNYYSPGESKDYSSPDAYKLYLTSDRPIYRPGQKIYFKGVIRKDNDGAYEKLKPGERVHFSVTDSRNRPVYSDDVSITSFGSFAGNFSVSKDADLGYYQLAASYNGNSNSIQVQVEEYRKPEVAVSVSTSKNAYVQGENAAVTINSSYYFGAPVTETPVTWTLQTFDYSFSWEKDWRYEFGDPDAYWSNHWWNSSGSEYTSGKKVTQGKGVTNNRGDLELQLPLDISKQSASQRMTVEAVVNDLNNQAIAASQEFTVHRGTIYAGLKPVSYANQSEKEAQVDIITVDLKGREVPNVPVTIEFYKRTWQTIRERNPDDGLFYYTSKPSDSLVATKSVTTDSLGKAVASFIPADGGTYKVVSRVKDATGNINSSGSFLWVSGYGFSAPRENNDRITLITDKRDYLVGENLSVFVASPFASSSAKTLLTVERGTVLDYKVVNTSETSNNFTLNVQSIFTPNVFVSALLIKGGNQIKNPPEFKIGYTEVKVSDKKQQLSVQITTDKKKYKPGETMKASIVTKDLLGNPVATELAIGIVDKAVWDLARVELPDIYKTFYQPRNLDVSTSQLLTISVDRINANTNLGAKGGSGGGGEGGSDTSRRDFPDTAYWNPYLKTDRNGNAELTVKLPDSLTTWKFIGIAGTEESAFGSVTSEFTVSRDVLIRPFLPRFLSVGDEAKLGAIIVNTSGSDQKLKAAIETGGLSVMDAKNKEISLSDGAQQKITWNTSVSATSAAFIRLSVTGDNNTGLDTMEVKLPVKSYSVPETVATSGSAHDTAEEKIILPKEIDSTQGQASFTFSPSLGSAAINSLPYLMSFPYYCTEQITSRIYPAVYVNRILADAKVDKSGSVNKKDLESVIIDGIQRLNNQQHPDGGWGWWLEDVSDPYLTAYAYQTLTEAKKDKFTVSDQTLNRAQNFLIGKLSGGVTLNLQAYILYVLKDTHVNLSAFAANLYDRRFEMSIETRAYLTMAMKQMSGMGSRTGRLYDELLSLAKKTSTTTHWEEPDRDYRFMGSNTTATATMLEMITQMDKNNPLIAEIIRYLLSIRIDNHWSSTRDTASVIKAVSGQLLAQNDTKVDENYKFELNGAIRHQSNFSKEDLLLMREYAVSISDFNIGSNNTLRFTKSGTGNFYYNINLKYYLPFSEIKPLEQGMVVMRELIDGKGRNLPNDHIDENTEAWVRLTIVAPEDRHFVVVEDVLPAGLEAVNESLKNTGVLNREYPVPADNSKMYYFNHMEYHDDRTTLFASYLPPGVYEVMYRVRATTPGRFHRPPAQAYQMYVPDISGHSDGGWFEVRPK